MVNWCLEPDLDKDCKLSIPSKYSIRDWIVTLFAKFFIMYSFDLSMCSAVILNGSFLQDLVFASYHPPLILVLHSELLLAWFEYQFLWSISDSYILISSNLCLFYIALKSNSDRLEQSLIFESYSVRSR